MRMFYTLAVLACLFLGGTVQAADLPCGPLTTVAHSFKFRPPVNTPEAPVSGYLVFVAVGTGAFGGGALINPTLDAEGFLNFNFGGFDTSRTYSIAVGAYGSGGNSGKSNTVTVVPTSSGVCPPPPAPSDLSLTN